MRTWLRSAAVARRPSSWPATSPRDPASSPASSGARASASRRSPGPTTTRRWRAPAPTGRMIEPALYDTSRLGDWAKALRRAPVLGLPLTLQESTVEWRPSYTPERYDAAEIKRRVQAQQVACGQALVGGLLEGCLARGIEPVLGARAAELIVHDGAVAGLVVERDGRRADLPARAVVLGLGRLRVERRAVLAVPARAADAPHEPTGQRGRRAADGDGGRCRPGEHERGVVVSRRRGARRGVRRAAARPVHRRGAHRPALDHGGPVRAPVRERGRQLQRHAEGVLRLRRQRRLAPPPAVLGGVRPAVPVAVPRDQRATRLARSGLAARPRHARRAWPPPRASTPPGSASPSSAGTASSPRAGIGTSAAATASTTGSTAIRRPPIRTSAASNAGRTTRCRSTWAPSGRAAVPGSTPTVACSTCATARSRVCTAPVTSSPAPPARPTSAAERPSAWRSCGVTSPARRRGTQVQGGAVDG